MAKRARTRQRGGKYMGEGAYGCVFQPALACIDDAANARLKGPDGKLRTDLVTKVLAPDNGASAADEMRYSRTLATIDPQQQCFLYPFHNCTVWPDTIRRDPEAAKCTLLSETTNRAKPWFALYLPAAETDLFTFLHAEGRSGRLARKAVLAMLAPCFEGVRRLVARHLVHQDIKPENIAVLKGGAQTRLIDFGLMKTGAEFYVPGGNDLLLKALYPINPPEYRFAHLSPPFDLAKERTLQAGHIGAALPIVMDAAYEASFAKLQADANASANAPAEERLRKLDALHNSDAYSLGYTLAKALAHLLPAAQDDAAAVAGYNALMHDLMLPHPRDRLKIDVALQRLQAIVAAPAPAQPAAAAPAQPAAAAVPPAQPAAAAVAPPAAAAVGLPAAAAPAPPAAAPPVPPSFDLPVPPSFDAPAPALVAPATQGLALPATQGLALPATQGLALPPQGLAPFTQGYVPFTQGVAPATAPPGTRAVVAGGGRPKNLVQTLWTRLGLMR